MSDKPVKALIKLQIEAGKATPAPPVGPALGQHGLNIMDFCKAYNDATKDQGGTVIPVIITVYADNTFSFICKTPPVSDLIKQKMKIKKGRSMPGRDAKLAVDDSIITEVAEIKMPDLNAYDIDAAKAIVAGSVRSMGFEVKGS